MQRTIPLTIAGVEYQFPVNYQVSRALSAKGLDPLAVLLRTDETLQMTGEEMIEFVSTGLQFTGAKMSREALGQAMMDEGLINFIGFCGQAIRAMTAGDPQQPLDAKQSQTPLDTEKKP